MFIRLQTCSIPPPPPPRCAANMGGGSGERRRTREGCQSPDSRVAGGAVSGSHTVLGGSAVRLVVWVLCRVLSVLSRQSPACCRLSTSVCPGQDVVTVSGRRGSPSAGPALCDGRLYCDTAAAAAATAAAVTATAQGHLSVALHQGRLPRRAAANRQATRVSDEHSIQSTGDSDERSI